MSCIRLRGNVDCRRSLATMVSGALMRDVV